MQTPPTAKLYPCPRPCPSTEQIRTVAAYNGEAKAQQQYDSQLGLPLKAGVKQGVIQGGAIGAMQFVMFISYGVALFYGAYRVASGHYTGGEVINVIISALMASFSLGMVRTLGQGG